MNPQFSTQFVIQFLIGLGLILLGAIAIYFFSSLAATFALAIVAYLIIDGPVKHLEHYGISRNQALLIVFLISHIMMIVFVLFLGTKIYSDVNAITTGIPTIKEKFGNIVDNIENMLPFMEVSQYLTVERLQTIQEYFFSIISMIISLMSTWLVNIFLIIPLLTVLLLTTGHRLKKGFLQLIPNSYFEMTVTIVDQIISTVREYIFARFLESTVIALICIVGFWLIGLPGAIVLGVLVGLFNLIPYFGPLLSLVPPVIMSVLVNDYVMGLSAIGIIFISQVVDNVYLQPVLVSKIVNIHPLIVVLVTFMGAELFGPIGMVIAIPAFTIGKILVLNLYQFLASLQRRAALTPAIEDVVPR